MARATKDVSFFLVSLDRWWTGLVDSRIFLLMDVLREVVNIKKFKGCQQTYQLSPFFG